MGDKEYKYKNNKIYVEDTSGRRQDNSENDVKILWADGDFLDVAKRCNLEQMHDAVEEAKKLIDEKLGNKKPKNQNNIKPLKAPKEDSLEMRVLRLERDVQIIFNRMGGNNE
jgi:hypothetical protein